MKGGDENYKRGFTRKLKGLSKVVEGNEHLHGVCFSTQDNLFRLQAKRGPCL